MNKMIKIKVLTIIGTRPEVIKLLLNPAIIYCLECLARKSDTHNWVYSNLLYRALGAAWLLQGMQSKKKGYSEVW